MIAFQDWLACKKLQQGEKFDPSQLATGFIPYFESGQRIEIEDEYGEKHQGYVGVTTGWRPAFLLVFNRRCRGSSVLLSERDKILRVFAARRER